MRVEQGARTVRVVGILSERSPSGRFVPGSYHTDGARLLRIVSEEANGGLRAVEDCKSLELLLVSVDELDSLGLQLVATESRPQEARLTAGSPS